MATVRYSDDDRERMRRDKEARMEEARREDLYVEFLYETGRMRVADRRPISEETMKKIASLDIRWHDGS